MILLTALALGLLGGWLAAPRYVAPDQADEERLRQRAARYYKAAKNFDYATMSLLFSAPRQLADTESLLLEAEMRSRSYKRMDSEVKADLAQQAETIEAAELQVNVEEGWARTGGFSQIEDDGRLIDIPLEDLAWIRHGGDWWIYSFTTAEINAFGNPPDLLLPLKESARMSHIRRQAELQQFEMELEEAREPQSGAEPPEPQSAETDPAEPESDSANGAGQ